MEHFARPHLVGYAIPVSAFGEFDAEPTETGDGAVLTDIFNVDEVGHDSPKTSFVDDVAQMESQVPEHAGQIQAPESLSNALSLLYHCDAFIPTDADLNGNCKPDQQINTPQEADPVITDSRDHAERSDPLLTESGQLGDFNQVYASKDGLFENTGGSELYRRVLAAYERPSQANPDCNDPGVAAISTQPVPPPDDILRNLISSLGGSADMGDLAAGTLTGQLQTFDPSPGATVDDTSLAHPLLDADASLSIPDPIQPRSTDEDDIRLHNALNALYLETAHHNAAMTSLQTQATACRIYMQNEPWSLENIAVFEERIEGYKREAHEEVARHERERVRLEKKVDEARDAMA